MSTRMETNKTDSILRRSVLAAGAGLLLIWMVFHISTLTSSQNGWIRFTLTFVCGALILFRPKPAAAAVDTVSYASPIGSVLSVAPGAAFVLMGLILDVHQLEWLGILLVVWGCLRWGLPDHSGPDLTAALTLLYFAHPLPLQIFDPLQLAMQRASVAGSEWLLLGLDVHVWADSLTLFTGFSAYEVPHWCSGMRTATTVWLLAFALGILNRFRWHECALIMLAALVQALALNIIRISSMVVLVPRFVDRSHTQFLHDTSGLIVLAAIFFVYAEILAWRRYQHRREAAAAPDGGLSLDAQIERPIDLQKMRSVRGVMVLAITLGATLTVMGSRNRPSRRLEVLKDVASSARDSSRFEEALNMVSVIAEQEPHEEEWKTAKIRLYLVLQRYADVLRETGESLPGGKQEEQRILRAYALMALNRMEEAGQIVHSLPGAIQRANPRVAMILAVMAHDAADVDRVARHVLLANRWEPNQARVRRLFPFLRRHRRWDVIAHCDSRVPYLNAEATFSATEAFMNLGDAPRVAELVNHILREWPHDPRTLEPLYFLTVKRPDSPWENRYRDQLLRSAKQMDNPDALYPLLGKCFELGRPDLAWHVYRSIEALDPAHPVLSWVVYQHGNQWFTFRRRAVGLPSPTAHNRSDLKSYYVLGKLFSSWGAYCALVPVGDALSATDTVRVRRDHLKKAIAGFRERNQSEALSLKMHYVYAHALELSGAYRESLDELRAISRAHPGEKSNVRVARSEMLERLGDWDGVYETLRAYPEDTERPALGPLLRLGRAQLNLQLNLAAEHTARESQKRYPRSAKAASFLVEVFLENGAAEEAMLLFERFDGRHVRKLDLLMADALYQSERFREAEAFCNNALIPRPPVYATIRQSLFLSPAHAAALWHHTHLPTDRAFRNNAQTLRANSDGVKGRFLEALMEQWLNCYASGSPGEYDSQREWEAMGRDRVEKAVALHQLTMLLCRAGRFESAAISARRATELLPEAPTLWRWSVSLSSDQECTVALARQHCPDDPELWLVDLGYRMQNDPNAIMSSLKRLLRKGPRFSVEAMIRAGEMLRGRELGAEACLLARSATQRARGLLPAYLFGIQCAVDAGDRTWALNCTQQAIAAALRPPPQLYKRLIDLKLSDGEPTADSDVVEALKSLRTWEPNNLLWAQMLGYVRFKRGGWEIPDAFRQMDAALSGGATNRLAFSIAAEASRQLGNRERSVEILRRSLKHYPDDLEFLNNLVYLLASLPDGLEEAEQLLPRLIEQGEDKPEVLDTITTVQLRSGNAEEARKTARRVLDLSETGSGEWFRANMHLAQMKADRQEWVEAIEVLTLAMEQARAVDDETVVEANRRLSRWRREHADSIQPVPPQRPAPF